MADFLLKPACLLALTAVLAAGGCNDDSKTLRRIQADRQLRQQSETHVDHLGEAMALVANLVQLSPESANRQILYHLNSWKQSQPAGTLALSPAASELLRSLAPVVPADEAVQAAARDRFADADIESLKLRYLYRQVAETVRGRHVVDPLFQPWIEQQRTTLGEDATEQLSVAARLFDWTIRNIKLEPGQVDNTAQLDLPLAMTFHGEGYRQTPYQTLFRGTGDGWQRTIAFLGLCRQADLTACLLALPPTQASDHQPRPWLAGVLIGGEVYLFDCRLGVPVIGPGQQGIATLTQARRDPTVLRRMNVPGWFDYPLQRDDVQQTVALLLVSPESISPRSGQLAAALTGDLRMETHDDAAAMAQQLTAVNGIATAAIWDLPFKAAIYRQTLERLALTDPMAQFYLYAPWAVLEGDFDQAKQLALGRWRHLQGDLDGDADDAIEGAKKLYLSQRQPEFEIAELRVDVELQKAYGIRRELRMTSEEYDRQIAQVQTFMRQGKVMATYWLSLIQYDTQRFDLARTWFQQRILDDGIESDWEVAARFNLARTWEQLDQPDAAIDLYRTEGSPQEHGDRLRARLLSRSADAEAETDEDADAETEN